MGAREESPPLTASRGFSILETSARATSIRTGSQGGGGWGGDSTHRLAQGHSVSKRRAEVKFKIVIHSGLFRPAPAILPSFVPTGPFEQHLPIKADTGHVALLPPEFPPGPGTSRPLSQLWAWLSY